MTVDLASIAAKLGFKVSMKKCRHMRMNHYSDAPIILHEKVGKEVNKFRYLGYKMTTSERYMYINTRLGLDPSIIQYTR